MSDTPNPIEVKYSNIDQFLMAVLMTVQPHDNPLMYITLLDLINRFINDFNKVFNKEKMVFKIDHPDVMIKWVEKINKDLFNHDLEIGVKEGLFEYRYDSEKDNFVYFKTDKYVERYGDSNMEPLELWK